jgi:hypothetical protein
MASGKLSAHVKVLTLSGLFALSACGSAETADSVRPPAITDAGQDAGAAGMSSDVSSDAGAAGETGSSFGGADAEVTGEGGAGGAPASPEPDASSAGEGGAGGQPDAATAGETGQAGADAGGTGGSGGTAGDASAGVPGTGGAGAGNSGTAGIGGAGTGSTNIGGAGGATEPPLPSGVILTKSVPLDSDARKTVVISDPEILKAGDFSLARTLDAMIASKFGLAAVTPEAREALLQTMIDGFLAISAVNEAAGVTMPLTVREGEAALKVKDLLDQSNPIDGMRPLDLVNRFDLAPADGAYCGEYRIVYGKGEANGFSRFLLIFEGALENPGIGIEGCRPAATFWSALPATASPKDTAKLLEKFYYEGGNGFAPVVTADHYGHPFGQVRGNFLVNTDTTENPWQLRQWSVEESGGALKFKPQPVADSPLPALYRDGEPDENPKLTALRTEFQDAFVGTVLDRLLSPETAAMESGKPVRDIDVINGRGIAVPEEFCGFESVSEPQQSAAALAGPTLFNRLTSVLAEKKLPYPLTTFEVLNQADSRSCNGCHQNSAGQVLAPAASFVQPIIIFPPSGGFVHMGEDGKSSPAAENIFFPARAENLRAFVDAAAGSTSPQAMKLFPAQTASSDAGLRAADRLKPRVFGGVRGAH